MTSADNVTQKLRDQNINQERAILNICEECIKNWVSTFQNLLGINLLKKSYKKTVFDI